jgi:YVTN family beta-propeller protein
MKRVSQCFISVLGLLMVAGGGMPVEAQPFAYVVNPGADTVSVINTATAVADPAQAVVDIIPVGRVPGGVAITPDGAFAYVAHDFVTYDGQGIVSVIATATNTVVATVPVAGGTDDVAITPDGAFAYVTHSGYHTVSVIATATNSLVATVPVLGFPFGVAITPDGAFAYVAHYGGYHTVSVIATATNSLVTTVPVAQDSFGVAITPDGAFAYVAGNTLGVPSSGTVSVIATATNTVVATVPVVGARFVAITPDGAFAYVTSGALGTVAVIATATNTVVDTIQVPAGYEAAITPDGAYVYVTNGALGTVAVIATATNTVVATIPVTGGPARIAITPVAAPPSAIVTVAATDPNAAEVGSNGSPDPGTFTVTRSGDTSQELTVGFTLGGTATQGIDYSNVGTVVTIPAGGASAAVTITPIPDTLAEGSETVLLTLVSGTGYTVGGPNTATVNIANYSGGLLRGAPLMNFGSVGVGSSMDRPLNITNGSLTAPLVVTINFPSPTPLFSLVSAAGTVVIGPGSSQQVRLRFSPTSTGSATGTLVLNSTDPANATKSIALQGMGR